jgi:FHS family Na+ dependent glucose MFS transporter 1
MNALHFFFGIGALLAPVIIGQVASFGGSITWAFVILAILILPVAAWLIRLPSPPVRTADSETDAEELPYGLVGLIALFYFLYVGAEVSYGGWIFTYATTKNLMGESAAYYLTAVFWGSFTMGRLLSIPLGVQFSPRHLLNGALLAGSLSIALILAWPNSLASLWMGTVGIGLAMAPVFPVMLAFLERRMVISGQITGWFFLGGSLGAMALPWLIGQRFESTGPAVTMVIIATALLAQVIVYLILLARFRNRGEKPL